MSEAVELIRDWRLLLLVVGAFGAAPGAVLRMVVRAYPRHHLRRRELLAELYLLGYLERPLFVAQQVETALFEGIPSRWHARRQTKPAASRRERFRDWRRHYIPLPDEVIDGYLAEDEYVVHYDHPSFRAFIVQNVVQVVILIAAGVWLLYSIRGGLRWDLQTSLALLALDVLLNYLAFRRLQARYTNYVITNLRVIRLSGIIVRRLGSIAWTRLTGIGYEQKALGRFLGYATIHIKTTNEKSGLLRFSEIDDPETFHEIMLRMASGDAGPWESEELPPPPTRGERKSLRERRRTQLARPQPASTKEPFDLRPPQMRTRKPTVDRDLCILLAVAAVIALVGLVRHRQADRKPTKH